MNNYLESVTPKKLGIAFPLTKIHYGTNFDLYCKQMLLSPLATLFKQTFEQAHATMHQQQVNEAELWSLRLTFERLQRIQSVFAKLKEEEERYLKGTKNYDTLRRTDQTHKKILAMIAQRLREYREQFEKIAAELAMIKKNIYSCLEEVRDLNLQIKIKSNAIVDHCFEIQKAISKNSDIFIRLGDNLARQLANCDSPLKEAWLAKLGQLKGQMYQASDKYLQWLAERSPAEADSLIQANQNAIIANYQALLTDMERYPDSAAWMPEFKQAFPELMQNLEIIVEKRKGIINLIEGVKIDRNNLAEKQAEFEQYIELAKKSIDEMAGLKKAIPQYVQLKDEFFNLDKVDSFEVKKRFKQKYYRFDANNSSNDKDSVAQSDIRFESDIDNKLRIEQSELLSPEMDWPSPKPIPKY